ncbi:diguanylate cyclase domain-containing protein [Paracoccus sp. KR1-242]|uniref:GGDEF domain-containing protein n=1 Tax=Paracoccus sp. KR1-242 TaxID=3410028 RepID=UPI003C019298
MSVPAGVLDLDALLPMHLLLLDGDRIGRAGPTLRKLIGSTTRLQDCLEVERPPTAIADPAGLCSAIASGEPVQMRLRHHAGITLRGRGGRLAGGYLLDLGLGMSLVQAVRAFDLNGADFTPSDLALELLFLHEANRAVMAELARTNRRLEEARAAEAKLAVTDALTGLLNRRGFQTELEQAMRSLRVQPFALAQLDLDDFKQVNDRFGHAAGDVVLQSVARALESETRATDRLGRMGGDEFMMILAGPVSAAEIGAIGRRIIARIREPVAFKGLALEVSASIGFSRSQDHDRWDLAAMMAEADSALYQDKARRRGQQPQRRRQTD